MTDAVKMAVEALRQIVALGNVTISVDPTLVKDLAASALAALEQAGEPVAVGAAGEMPGSNGGFSMAVFKASDVPIGASLYTQPPLPTLQRLGQEFDAGEAVAWQWRHPRFGEGCAWLMSCGPAKGSLGSDGAEYRRLYAHPPQSRGQAFDGEGEARKILRAISARMTIACDWTKAGKDHIKVRTADWHVLMEIGQQARALSSAKRGEKG